MAHLFAKQRLFRTADGKIVDEANPAAAFLFATEGDEITPEDAEQYGLNARSPLVRGTPEQELEEKQADKLADKALAAPSNKGRSRA